MAVKQGRVVTRHRSGGRKPRRIDPLLAERVKVLRQARGLTQADLAGDRYTKGFISLVETGRVGLSIPTAQYLANRLGVSMAELIGPSEGSGSRDEELLLTRAEASFAAGRPEEALAAGRSLARASGPVRSRWTRLHGRILAQSERPRDALLVLDEALRSFRAQGSRDLAARTLFDLAQAYGRVEAHGEAIHYALQCESAINAGDVVDRTLELRVLSTLAALFVTIGDLVASDVRIERARRVAEDISDPFAVGDLYANLAIAREREGAFDEALAFARKSLQVYEHMGIPAHVGNLWTTIGWIEIKRHSFGEATAALERAERIARDIKDPRLMAYVIQNRAELALARGQTDSAEDLAQSSADHPGASRRGRGLSLLVKAEAMARGGEPLSAVNHAFSDAAKALRPFGSALEARAHQAHFDALVARGRTTEAVEAARRAFEASVPRRIQV